MNTRQIVSLFLMLMMTFSLSAQNIEKSISENIGRSYGHHHAYEFCEIVDSPAPSGYEPFYIAHFGRHGSRFDTSASNFKKLVADLSKADAEGILTENGRDLLLAEQNAVRSIEGLGGMLTVRGMNEHSMIAKRMYDRFSSVFTNPERNHVNCVSTIVPRCIVSMSFFEQSLKDRNKALQMSMAFADSLQQYLTPKGVDSRLFDVAKAHNDAYKKANIHSEELISKIFNDTDKAAKLLGDLDEFAYSVFKSTSFCETMDLPELSAEKYFSFNEIVRMAKVLSANFWYTYLNAPGTDNARVKATDKMLMHIIEKADAAVAGNNVAADLRFAHDTGLIPLSSLMGVSGQTGAYYSEELENHWFTGDQIFMATNMQLVFYRNSKNDILVKLLYSEKERTFEGLKPYQGVYYRWKDLRKYWMNRIDGNL